METENIPPTPTIALLLTERKAELLTAALSHYRTYAKRHPELELDQAAVELEELQRGLINEVRSPTIPAVDVEAVQKLSELNQARQSARLDSAARRRADRLFSTAYTKLTVMCTIPVHLSDAWHFGREEPPKLLKPLHNEAGGDQFYDDGTSGD